MSALGRFLARDTVAKALLVTILSGAALAAAPGGSHAPGIATGPLTASGPTLVMLDVEARRMGGVAERLARSTTACLADQARLLGPSGIASTRPGAAVAAIGEREAALASGEAASLDIDAVLAAIRSPRGDGGLARHAALREACLVWSRRSVAVARAALGAGDVAPESLRAVSARDARYAALAGRQDPADLNRTAFELMETWDAAGPRGP